MDTPKLPIQFGDSIKIDYSFIVDGVRIDQVSPEAQEAIKKAIIEAIDPVIKRIQSGDLMRRNVIRSKARVD